MHHFVFEASRDSEAFLLVEILLDDELGDFVLDRRTDVEVGVEDSAREYPKSIEFEEFGEFHVLDAFDDCAG